MNDRLVRLEARVEDLALVLEELAARVRSLEEEAPLGSLREAPASEGVDGAAFRSAEPPAASREPADPGADTLPQGAERWGPVPLLGRTLMVLGGAYFFRALTEAGTLPSLAGLGLGMAYAVLWLGLADRAAVAGRRLSASFHGAAFALIAAPLTWEAASRFRAVSGTQGALALTAVTAAALAVAWRRDLRAVAWFGSLAGLLAAWAFMGSVEPVVASAAVLVLIAVASDWIARDRDWRVLPWVTAAAAHVTVALMALGEILGRGGAAHGGTAGGTAVGLAALLLGHFTLFAGSAAARAARRDWQARWLDLLQLPAALLIGYAGAFLLARRVPALAVGMGVVSVLAGLAALEVTRRLFGRRAERRSSYVFFAWTGLVLVLGGTTLLLPPAGRAVTWSVLAVASAVVASRRRSVTLGLHAWVYGTAAAAASGLLAYGLQSFAASPAAHWVPLASTAWLVLVALAAAVSFDLPTESPFWSRIGARAVKLLLLAVLAWGAFGVLCGALAGPVAGAAGAAGADPAALALLRMALIAAAALALALLGRLRRYREAAWLVYPVLVLGGFKLILEDFLLGRAAELFGALALYGAVLIVAPRVARVGPPRDHPAG